MWNTAMAINTCIWTLLGVFLVYSAGTLVLQGAWHQFLYAAFLFFLCNMATVIMATQG
jgi:hypothetical protein